MINIGTENEDIDMNEVVPSATKDISCWVLEGGDDLCGTRICHKNCFMDWIRKESLDGKGGAYPRIRL
jgi:hypothetical protein